MGLSPAHSCLGESVLCFCLHLPCACQTALSWPWLVRMAFLLSCCYRCLGTAQLPTSPVAPAPPPAPASPLYAADNTGKLWGCTLGSRCPARQGVGGVGTLQPGSSCPGKPGSCSLSCLLPTLPATWCDEQGKPISTRVAVGAAPPGCCAWAGARAVLSCRCGWRECDMGCPRLERAGLCPM